MKPSHTPLAMLAALLGVVFGLIACDVPRRYTAACGVNDDCFADEVCVDSVCTTLTSGATRLTPTLDAPIPGVGPNRLSTHLAYSSARGPLVVVKEDGRSSVSWWSDGLWRNATIEVPFTGYGIPRF